MEEIARHNPTGRFTGLADLYARHRPGYPARMVDFIIEHCQLTPGSRVVDVGSGTGISSRLLAARGLEVIGIEPNAEMRARAEAEPAPPGTHAPSYRDGRAEATGLPGGLAQAVVCAQAFHWFEPAAALAEFQRLLRPGGWVLLFWNERAADDPFTAAYGAIIRTAPEAAAVETPRGQAGSALLQSPLFTEQAQVIFPNEQVLDLEGLLGRAFSASYAPRDPRGVESMTAALRKLFAEHQRQGRVVLRYHTDLYLGRRGARTG